MVLPALAVTNEEIRMRQAMPDKPLFSLNVRVGCSESHRIQLQILIPWRWIYGKPRLANEPHEDMSFLSLRL